MIIAHTFGDNKIDLHGVLSSFLTFWNCNILLINIRVDIHVLLKVPNVRNLFKFNKTTTKIKEIGIFHIFEFHPIITEISTIN